MFPPGTLCQAPNMKKAPGLPGPWVPRYGITVPYRADVLSRGGCRFSPSGRYTVLPDGPLESTPTPSFHIRCIGNGLALVRQRPDTKFPERLAVFRDPILYKVRVHGQDKPEKQRADYREQSRADAFKTHFTSPRSRPVHSTLGRLAHCTRHTRARCRH